MPDDKLVKVEPSGALEIFEARPDLRDSVADYARASEAKNTARARHFDWKVFTEWCAAHGQRSLPALPAVAAAFLADQAKTKAAATVVRYARSIDAVHRLQMFKPPCKHEAVRKVLRGIRREKGVRQKQRDAFTAEVAERALASYAPPSELALLRDRAIALVGLNTAMRGSELCSLDVEDLHPVPDGYVISLRRSKTDQEGEGVAIALWRNDESPEFCPVHAVDAWIAAIDLKSGPLFCGFRRNGAPKFARTTALTVNAIVKKIVAAAGLSDANFGAHSLRAGYVTTARMQGVDWASIMEQTRHKRLETVKLYTRYTPEVFAATRVADVFRNAFKSRKEK